MTSKCEAFRREIPKAISGELSPAVQRALNRHLEECPACRIEQEQYAETLTALRTLEDEPTPRHFFVYPQAGRLNPWQVFRRMARGWQAAAAVAAVVAVVAAGAAMARLQIKVSAGVFYAGFGRLPAQPAATTAPPTLDTSDLEARILQAAEQKSIENDRLWVAALRTELNRSVQALTREQRDLLDAALAGVETRLDTRIAVTAQSMQTETLRSLQQLYQLVSQERTLDLTAVNDRFSQLALTAAERTNQTDAILETLLQVAELKLGTTPGGQK